MRLQRPLEVLSRTVLLPVLFLISFSHLFSGIRSGLNVYDEGLVVYGAARILNGEVPYRDFWTLYAPGQFYALALLFKVLGPSIMAARVFSRIVQFLITVITYMLTRKLVPMKLALLSLFLINLSIDTFIMYSSPTLPAMLFSLLSCLALAEFISKKSTPGLLIAGALAGASALFKQDIGFYTFLSETGIVILFAYASLSESDSTRSKRFSESLRTWSKYLAGTAVVILPAALFFIYSVPMRELLSDLVLFPTTIFPEFRRLPFPAPVPNPVDVSRARKQASASSQGSWSEFLSTSLSSFSV